MSRAGGPATVIKLESNGDPIRSLTSAVRERLRAEIAACHILPGEKLHLARLAGHYGISLGAVRAALSRLVAEGWIQAEDQRGFHASPVSMKDLNDITWARIEIEGIALRLSIELGDAEWEEQVRRAHRDLSEARLPPPGNSGPVLDAWRALHGASTWCSSADAVPSGCCAFDTCCTSNRSAIAFSPTA